MDNFDEAVNSEMLLNFEPGHAETSMFVPPVGQTAATVPATGGKSGPPIDVQPALAANSQAYFGNSAAAYEIQDLQHDAEPLFTTSTGAFGGDGGIVKRFGMGGNENSSSFDQLPFFDQSASSQNDPSYNGVPNYVPQQQNGTPRFSCKDCSKTFAIYHNLLVHARTHTKERLFKCNLCTQEFTQFAHLQKHQEVHAGEPQYPCEICDKRLSTVYKLKAHLRTHNGEKPYTCDVCNAKFTRNVHLRVHKQTHANNEKPYSCGTCGKKYKSNGHLTTHWITTTCKKDDTTKMMISKGGKENLTDMNGKIYRGSVGESNHMNNFGNPFEYNFSSIFGQGPSGVQAQQAPPPIQQQQQQYDEYNFLSISDQGPRGMHEQQAPPPPTERNMIHGNSVGHMKQHQYFPAPPPPQDFQMDHNGMQKRGLPYQHQLTQPQQRPPSQQHPHDNILQPYRFFD